MKKTICSLGILVVFLLGSCGGTSKPQVTGPILESDEAKSLLVDQFYVNGGLQNDFGTEGEFNVYLRDAATGEDIVCAGKNEGMSALTTPAVYYGGLNVNFTELKTEHPSSSARFQIVVVEKNSEECPAPIDNDDTIVGTSEELTFDQLVEKQIWTTNGLASITLRADGTDPLAVASMAPALSNGLAIDRLFFDNGGDGETEHRYYIFAEKMEKGVATSQCQVDDSYMKRIQYGKIVYAALGIPISCFTATDPNFVTTEIKVSLWIQQDDGLELIGETEVKAIGDMIGERIEFTNQSGYIKFQMVSSTPFSSSIVRLGELTSLAVTSLTYVLSPTLKPTVEVHAIAGSSPYAIACAGEAQGLKGVSVPGEYTDLSAPLVAVTGQQELFGWSDVTIEVVERTDSGSCPDPISTTPTVLAKTTTLTASALSAGSLTFQSGGGKITLTQQQADQTSNSASSSAGTTDESCDP